MPGKELDLRTPPLPPVYDGLDKAASDLAQAAMRPGIGGKQDVLYRLSGGLQSVSRAVGMIADSLREAGYGPEIVDPIDISCISLFAASTKAEEAMHAVGALANTTLRNLGASGRQAPDQSELNGAT